MADDCHNETMNAEIEKLADQLDRHGREAIEMGYAPQIHMLAIGIDDGEEDMRAVLLCRNGISMAALLMPRWWLDPDEAGNALVVPPDSDGWEAMDRLIEAGVEDIQFRAV